MERGRARRASPFFLLGNYFLQKRDFRACRRVLQVKSFSEGWKRMDQATFTLLADRYMDMVFRLARRMLTT